MTDAPEGPPTDSDRLTRREGLRQAAAVLAVGLGAPVTVLGEVPEGEIQKGPFTASLYVEDGREPLHRARLTEEATRMLLERGVRVFYKVEDSNLRSVADFQLERVD